MKLWAIVNSENRQQYWSLNPIGWVDCGKHHYAVFTDYEKKEMIAPVGGEWVEVSPVGGEWG